MPMIRKLSLGDKFPRKLLCVQKTSLEVGLIAPNTKIDTLRTKLWVGNKRLQGELGNVIKAHEENSFVDSGLRKKERRKDRQVKCRKEGWIEEVESKFSSRETKTLREGKKVENITNNKFLMEYAREHVEATKRKKRTHEQN